MRTPSARNIMMANAFKLVAESLKDESDRGTVVLAAAWLDESLTRIIRKFFKPINNNKENLLRAGQPLGDFGTKIVFAERLGLLHNDLISSLTLCRKLRNDFAHLSSDLSFSTPYVKDRVNELFRLNEDLLLIMGKSLSASGLTLNLEKGEEVTAKALLTALGTKRLFGYTCGLINAALSIIEYDIKPHETIFEPVLD